MSARPSLRAGNGFYVTLRGIEPRTSAGRLTCILLAPIALASHDDRRGLQVKRDPQRRSTRTERVSTFELEGLGGPTTPDFAASRQSDLANRAPTESDLVR